MADALSREPPLEAEEAGRRRLGSRGRSYGEEEDCGESGDCGRDNVRGGEEERVCRFELTVSIVTVLRVLCRWRGRSGKVTGGEEEVEEAEAESREREGIGAAEEEEEVDGEADDDEEIGDIEVVVRVEKVTVVRGVERERGRREREFLEEGRARVGEASRESSESLSSLADECSGDVGGLEFSPATGRVFRGKYFRCEKLVIRLAVTLGLWRK